MRVVMFTSHEQTEQGLVIEHVTALTVVEDLLTIEAEVDERGHRFRGHHRFAEGEWTHFEVYA